MMAASHLGGRLRRRAARTNPYTAVANAAAENPRLAVLVGSVAATTMGMALLIVVSSAQAFVVISHQSSSNTRSQLSLLVDGGSGGSAAGGAAGDRNLPTGTVGPEDVVSVRGIRVHRSIAADVRALLEHAEADGVELSGWGWRDGQTQIRLRRRHCGTSEYAIYRMPSSQCRPPTARPGRSQHERGLAIDFTYRGGSISSRRNPGFRWLQANAATYGLKNLKSEPWHWSTNGR